MKYKWLKIRNKEIKSIIIIILFFGFSIFIPPSHRNSMISAASVWTQTSDKDFDNGTLNNLTIVGIGENAELKIDFSDLNQWKELDPINSPSEIYNDGMATICTDDKVVRFGGIDLDETWEYDLSTNTWTNKNPSGSKPSIRIYPQMTSFYGDDKVLLFGGAYGFAKNDTWEYDSSTGSWTEQTITSGPIHRCAAGMAPIYGYDKVVMFGGSNYYNSTPYYLNDTWVYDSSEASWTDKTPSSIPTNYPSGRLDLAMASIYGTDKVLLFSGRRTFDNCFSDTWLYDYSDNNWTNITPISTSPSARYGHRMVSIQGDDKVLLFGGATSGSANYFLNDTWTYDLSDNTWTKIILINPSKRPSARVGFGLAAIDGQDKIILFGGNTDSGYSNETWVYTHILPMKNGTYVSSPHDTGSRSDFDTISWIAKIPDNTSIKFQLRTAINQSLITTKEFVGPDGTTTSFYTASPTDIWFGHDHDRWIQYKGYFNISIIKDPPSLKDVTISYNCLPNTMVIDPINGTLLPNNRPTFKWTFDDFDSEEQKAFQIIISDNISFENILFDTGEQITPTESWEFPTGTSYTVIPDGTWYWKVRTRDVDNVWTEYSEPWEFIIDTVSPSSAPTIPINNGIYQSLKKVTGICTDPIASSGILQVEISIQRLSNKYYWDGKAWGSFLTWLKTNGTSEWTYDTTSISWTSGMKYKIQSRATDFTGNIEQPTSGNIFTMDMGMPSSKINFPSNDVWLNKLEEISGDSKDIDGSGTDIVEISIQRISDKNYWYSKGWVNSGRWLTTVGTKEWTYNSATDNVNNIEKVVNGITINYDAKPPDQLSIIINKDDIYTTKGKVNLSLQARDLGSYVSLMSFSTNGKEWTAWEPYNISISFDLPIGDGEKSVYFRVNDLAGNIAEAVFDTVILDTAPPKELSLIINNNEKYTNSNIVTLTINALDELSGISGISLSTDNNNWLPWESYKSTRSYSFNTEDNGEKRIYLKAIDVAGNIADPVSDLIILDNDPPHSLSILIDKGASLTNSTFVTLDLNALDDLSNVTHMAFSADGEIWNSWEIYSNSKIYELLGEDGNHTIHFKVKDMLGNIAKSVSATIILNTSIEKIIINSTEKEKSSPDMNNWIIILIVIIIIIVLISIGYALFIKRKKRINMGKELLPAGALTIKPGGLALSSPMINVGNLQGSAALTQLPSANGTSSSNTTISVPMLARSTQTTQQQIPGIQRSQQPSQAVQELPALPPAGAQTQNTRSPGITQPTPITTNIPTITPASQDSQKQLKSNLSSLPQMVQQNEDQKD